MTVADRDGAGTGITLEHEESALLSRHLDERFAHAVRILFDDSYYRVQTGLASVSRREALEHYLEVGWREGFDPNPLFDSRYYLERNPAVSSSGENPLLHYLGEGAPAGADPNPYFDTDYYYSQQEQLSRHVANALVHYVEHAPQVRACNPNPLFGNGYYVGRNPDVRSSGENPFVHFLQRGRVEGRAASPTHAELVRKLPAQPRLLRGRWRSGSVLFLLHDAASGRVAAAAREVLREEHNLDAQIVVLRRSPEPDTVDLPSDILVLGDHERSADLLRPSAVRLLGLALASGPTIFTVGDVVELLPAAQTAGVPAYFLVLDGDAAGANLDYAAPRATRIVFGSRELFRRAAGPAGPYPANSVVRPFEGDTVDEFVDSALELAARDGATPAAAPRRHIAERSRKVLVPCTDWAVSGVNTALEAVGQELIRLGWDVEILFTRDRALVEESLGPAGQLPDLPHRWLSRRRPGVDGMWETLIAEVQASAPCIVFTGYDFYGNSVVPALTNDVGVVMWAQADDGDYYEQAYRLGRYCNAIVCVSGRIRDQIASIHPGLETRAHVIHNTSVRDADVLRRQRRRSEKLRIVYTGRLVQYQKRVLDFVRLADELEALGLEFTIDLIGTAPRHDEAASLLPLQAARHLDHGRMRLLGRLSRSEVLAELRAGDLFVLLSDFEGLPLSLVEAMASGCVPVVAEMKSGISELLVPDENGLIVHGRDYAHWARTIRDLWHDEARLAVMAEQAQQTIRSSFTVEAIGARFDALFNTVAEEVANGYERPPALTWGARRAPFGDVLPPPTMHRAVPVAGLG